MQLAEGGALVDPRTGAIIASRGKTYAPTAPVSPYEISGGVRLNKFTGETELIPGAGGAKTYRDLSPDEIKHRKLPAGVTYAQVDSLGQVHYTDPKTGEDKTFAQSKDLRTAYEKQVQPAREVATAYRKVEGGFSQGTSAGDIAGIFGFMKLLDPGSTVREGEYATVEQAGTVPDRIIQLYNKTLESGELLLPEKRQELLEAAASQLEPYRRQVEETQNIYTDLSEGFELDPKRIVTPSTFPR